LLGWYRDEILVFVVVVHIVVRLIKEHRSGDWPVVQGSVVKVYPPRPLIFPQVEVAYTYRVDGKLYTGMHSRGFFLKLSAEDYANQFHLPRSVVVRYRLGEPTASVVRQSDQVNQGARAFE